jgi:hypothetical protein
MREGTQETLNVEIIMREDQASSSYSPIREQALC